MTAPETALSLGSVVSSESMAAGRAVDPHFAVSLPLGTHDLAPLRN